MIMSSLPLSFSLALFSLFSVYAFDQSYLDLGKAPNGIPTQAIPIERVNVTAHDGITLEAIMIKPLKCVRNCPGIVFISSWGLNKYEYIYPAFEYYRRGYNVISYTARGFWGSSERRDLPGGEIELAGANDVADVSTMIDYLLANTKTDVTKIGVSGISYGGGLALLGAASDKRVKATISMSCWTDLVESLYGNGGTIRSEGVDELQGLADHTGTVGKNLEYLFDNYFARTNIKKVEDMVKDSSPINHMDGINANKPAIFIANAYGDNLFTPNQFPAFFDLLEPSIPTHIEFAPGDHAGPELPGLFPAKGNITSRIFDNVDEVWSRAFTWADAYIINYDATIKAGVPVLPAVILGRLGSNNTIESFNSLSAITTSTTRLHLAGRPVHGKLMPYNPEIVRQKSMANITTGSGVNVRGGIALFTATLDSIRDQARKFVMHEFDYTYGAFFLSALWEDTKTRKVRGIPSVSLSLQLTSEMGLLVVYLLDCDRAGALCSLVTFAPYTYESDNKIKGKLIYMFVF